MGEGSGRHLVGFWHASGGIWEAYGRHLGCIWGTSGGSMGFGGHPGAREASWRQNAPNSLRFTAFEKKGTVSRRRHELDLHVDQKFTATYADRSRARLSILPLTPYRTARTPTDESVWGITC